MNLGHRFVHVPDVPDNLQPFGQRNNGRPAFGCPEQLIGNHTGDQVVTALPGLGQKVEVTDME